VFFTHVSRVVLVLISIASLASSQFSKDPNNLIKNGGFDEGAKSWTYLLSHKAEGTSSVVDGQMVCKITLIGEKAFTGLPVGVYDHQIIQENLTLTNGVTYFMAMDVKADTAMEFQFALESQNDEAGTQYALVNNVNPRQKLSSTMQTFTRTFKMTKPTAGQVRLSVSFGGTLTTVTVDNVCLVDSSKMTAIHPQLVRRDELANSGRIFIDAAGISFHFANATHCGYQIYSMSGKVIAGSASQYRINYRSLGISSGTYIVRTLDGNQHYSTTFSVLP
jgi:hypothetical protein